MARKKDSLALFEVIQKAGEKRQGPGVDVPGQPVGEQQKQQQKQEQQKPVAEGGASDPLQTALPRPTGVANGPLGTAKERIFSRQDGKVLATVPVDGFPAYFGMSVAGKRLFVSTREGRLICFQGK